MSNTFQLKKYERLLQENIGRTLFDIYHSKIFFDPPHRVMEIKTKTNKWDLMKLKRFCKAKETTNKTKRQPSEWEKIFANEATDKGLIFKIYKQFMQLNIKKTNKWDLGKLKCFCTAKETIKKMKRQPTERVKIFANHVTDKGLICKISNSSYNSISKKQTTQSKNGLKT